MADSDAKSQLAKLADEQRRAEQQKWLDENREAIENHNGYIAKYGVFSDGRRRF